MYERWTLDSEGRSDRVTIALTVHSVTGRIVGYRDDSMVTRGRRDQNEDSSARGRCELWGISIEAGAADTHACGLGSRSC